MCAVTSSRLPRNLISVWQTNIPTTPPDRVPTSCTPYTFNPPSSNTPALASSIMGATVLADLPTLTQLYARGALAPARHAVPALTPPAEIASTALSDAVSLLRGDITQLALDAVVNAANNALAPGSGVNGAIHRAAGPSLVAACKRVLTGGCATGDAVVTTAGKMPSRLVVHTVGPVYGAYAHTRAGAEEAQRLLTNCYQRSLEVAVGNGARTLAFPAISTGIFGYPVESAAHVAARTVRDYLLAHKNALDRVVFVVFSVADEEVYRRVLPTYFPPPPEVDETKISLEKLSREEKRLRIEKTPSPQSGDKQLPVAFAKGPSQTVPLTPSSSPSPSSHSKPKTVPHMSPAKKHHHSTQQNHKIKAQVSKHSHPGEKPLSTSHLKNEAKTKQFEQRTTKSGKTEAKPVIVETKSVKTEAKPTTAAIKPVKLETETVRAEAKAKVEAKKVNAETKIAKHKAVPSVTSSKVVTAPLAPGEKTVMAKVQTMVLTE
ncbi:uncharacterized protein V1518DRAFT_421660 [Limtongia smithiae]|uniref:uncharacterized protein n=1 Tax=Limtongia smithiae TaxID=1125753 RepID=UPI0034CDA3EF